LIRQTTAEADSISRMVRVTVSLPEPTAASFVSRRVSIVRPATILVRLVDPHRCHPMSRPNPGHSPKTTT
jgi:hypothetical protein